MANKESIRRHHNKRITTCHKHGGGRLRSENEHLQSEIIRLKQLLTKLEEQASLDPLTGVFNRRRVEFMLAADDAPTRWGIAPVSIVMLDMDNFKGINDAFGHVVGDLALKTLGKKLRQMTRAEDIVCRYGGDEFIVFLYNVSCETAYKRVEEWRRTVEESPIIHQSGRIRITITAGIASYAEHGDTLAKTIKAADRALYWAKGMGRNCVATADDVNQTFYSFPYNLLTNREFANVESGFCN
ncbi:MAG: GGDEF domain-containing protein [Chloroflexi bacterium]|nr:GGDEF domain-containing protein [Chloroflexota bacterium]